MVAAFDEMKEADGGVRPAYGELARWLDEVPADVLDYRRREAELLFPASASPSRSMAKPTRRNG